MYSLLGLTAPMWVPGVAANRLYHCVSGKPREEMPKERAGEDFKWGLWPITLPFTLLEKVGVITRWKNGVEPESLRAEAQPEKREVRYLSVHEYLADTRHE